MNSETITEILNNLFVDKRHTDKSNHIKNSIHVETDYSIYSK